MLDLLGTVMTGGLSGLVGSLIGKAFSFLDAWQEERKAGADHQRTLEMLEMQGKMKADEAENEMRIASYGHDTGIGTASQFVINFLRLVRPILTFTLICLLGILYFQSDAGGKATIEASVIFMASSATLWWFGERSLRKKT
jgi:hypothetical protein